MAMIAMAAIMLTSCEDEDIAYKLSEFSYKNWEGRISTYYYDRWGLTGNDYYTVMMFESDDYSMTKGHGMEVDYDVNDRYGNYWYSQFVWRVDNGVIELLYDDTRYKPIYIYDYTLSDNYFSGYMDDGTSKDIEFNLRSIGYFDWSRYYYYHAPSYPSPKMMPGEKGKAGGERVRFGSKGSFVKAPERMAE